MAVQGDQKADLQIAALEKKRGGYDHILTISGNMRENS